MKKITLNQLGHRAFDNAKAKGFHDNPVPIPTCLMLIVSELSEAMEADRKNKRADLAAFNTLNKIAPILCTTFKDRFETHIKDTFEDELADALIRLVELAASLGIDLDTHVQLKMRYNATRPHKHGKKY